MKRQSGFTLIEVIVSSAILASILLTATLSFSFFMEKWQVNSQFERKARKWAEGILRLSTAVEQIQDYYLVDEDNVLLPFFLGEEKRILAVSSGPVSGINDNVLFSLEILEEQGKNAVFFYREWQLTGNNLYQLTDLGRVLSTPATYSFRVRTEGNVNRFEYLGVKSFDAYLNPGLNNKGTDLYHNLMQWQQSYNSTEIKVLPRAVRVLASESSTEDSLIFSVPYYNEHKLSYLTE